MEEVEEILRQLLRAVFQTLTIAGLATLVKENAGMNYVFRPAASPDGVVTLEL